MFYFWRNVLSLSKINIAMPKKEVKVKFSFSYGHLIELSEEKIDFMRRDKAEFEGYGITDVEVSSFEDELNNFADLPTDEELEAFQVEQGKIKITTQRVLTDYMRDEIYSRARSLYGDKSAKYRRFGRKKDLENLSDADLQYTARRAIRVCEELLGELSARGLTSEKINQLKTNFKNFNIAEGDHNKAISDRDIATEERIESANLIYDKLVSFCDTGRSIWQSKNEAKYNDYIIYEAPPEPSNNESEEIEEENGEQGNQ